jgi:hypothetical protein
MKFIREIPESKITQTVINNLEQWGFTLIWRVDSVEIWANVSC